MSTGAGIGTAIAGLITVDILRFRDSGRKSDRYFLGMTRLFASLSIVCGTMFAMLIPTFGGMIPFYVALTGTFFLPLTVPYVGGALYKNASRGAGLASLLSGTGLGCILFLLSHLLPTTLGHPQWRPFWVLGFSIGIFVIWSKIENRLKGSIPNQEIASILNSFELGKTMKGRDVLKTLLGNPLRPWPGRRNLDFNTLGVPDGTPWYLRPDAPELTVTAILIVLMLWWW
jgi:hypothetical protein